MFGPISILDASNYMFECPDIESFQCYFVSGRFLVTTQNEIGPISILGVPIMELGVPISILDDMDCKTRNEFLPIMSLGAQLHNGQDFVIGLD